MGHAHAHILLLLRMRGHFRCEACDSFVFSCVEGLDSSLVFSSLAAIHTHISSLVLFCKVSRMKVFVVHGGIISQFLGFGSTIRLCNVGF